MVEVVGALPSFHLSRAIYIEWRASITGWPGGVIFGTRTDGLLVSEARVFWFGRVSSTESAPRFRRPTPILSRGCEGESGIMGDSTCSMN